MTVGENNFRCRVGHAWTGDSLLQARDDEVESAFWVALRSLREKIQLSRRLAETAGSEVLRRRYLQAAEDAEKAVSILGARLSATPKADEQPEA